MSAQSQLPLGDNTEVVDNLGEEDVEVPFQYSIASYGADYPIDGLIRRLVDGSIFVPSFQRSFVWNIKQSSRFIESLLLGLPVPGIFLSKDTATQKLLVIDGQQRLRSLQYFYVGEFPDKSHIFTLKGVQPQYEGLTYNTLSDEDRRRLDDSIIHATVVRQEEPSDDISSIYLLFERLNTGGVLLQPQEIRACIYIGGFKDLLGVLNDHSTWRAIYGAYSARMKDQELILRFLALYFYSDNYKRPMTDFLNRYMGGNRFFRLQPEKLLSDTFINTIDVVYNAIGSKAFRRQRALNAAVFDSVMVGIARRLERGSINDYAELDRRYQSLLEDDYYSFLTRASTSNDENIERRLALTVNSFSNVE